MVELSSQLNPEQQAAVLHVEGPLLVIAGAGSGKTRIVSFRITHLLEIGVPASEIVAVTFTNKAAAEMKHRVESLAHTSVLTCTFHSLCARILRESIHALGYDSHFTILDEDDSEKVLKEVLAALNLKDEKGLQKTVRSSISHAKNNLLDPDTAGKEDPILREAYDLYQKRLKEYNALDFDDLLFLTVKLFKEHPDILEKYQRKWTFILIDEYQDTNFAQHTIMRLLAAKHFNVFAVGDPDQSIYSWRGANVHNILNFERDFPGAKIIKLEQNYRSCNTILEAANALIKHNESRYEKNLWSTRGAGEKVSLYICDTEHQEAEFIAKRILKHYDNGIPLRDCAIFYRTNFQSRVFEDIFLRNRIPYTIIGGVSFYQRREIKDILSFLRFALNNNDFLSFSRTINLPKRGLGEVALNKIRQYTQDQSVDLFTACTQIELSAKQKEALREYTSIISSLREYIKQRPPLDEIISETIQRCRYLDFLKEDPDTFQEREENIKELISKAAEWQREVAHPTLTAFLEELSLKSSADQKEAPSDAVKLMTVHNGKGLEFIAVFLAGLEEDLFPHVNVKESYEGMEEERRLFYVGMTRAKDYLYLTASRHRFLWGTSRSMQLSRFLNEIPQEYIHPLHEKAPVFTEDGLAEFAPGDTVHHRDFGAGIVQRTYNTSMGLTYDVFFPQSHITRSLVGKYAKLYRS